MVDELKPPVSAIKVPQPIERPATSSELRLFSRFQAELDRLERLVQSAGLRLENIYLAARYASAAGLPVISVSAAEEESYFSISDSARKLRAAERAVMDWSAGIRLTSSGRDIDIALFPGQQLSGLPLVIPVLIGVVIAAAVIAVCVEKIREARELNAKFNAVMKTADRELCKDPNSETCQAWKIEKQTNNWKQNKSISDSIGSGIEKIAGGLGLGLIVALGVFAYMRGRT
ncbi:MAG: hypothetical protein WC372_07270 [Candidatus Neomarinimicrobiota bacterium]|jgi:hypothetical protein